MLKEFRAFVARGNVIELAVDLFAELLLQSGQLLLQSYTPQPSSLSVKNGRSELHLDLTQACVICAIEVVKTIETFNVCLVVLHTSRLK